MSPHGVRPFLFGLVTAAVLVVATPAPVRAAPVAWRDALKQPAAWYATPAAAALADNVLLYQTETGGWPKNRDMSEPPATAATAKPFEDHIDVTLPTIDNGATTTQLALLARVHTAQPNERYRAALQRGLDYLFRAQYANGGWPQFFPLRPGYYTHITFNDDAMIHVLALLREVARGREPFAWTDAPTRTRAAHAIEKGVECILRCQIVVGGVKTVWCAQHDENTFEPAPARKYEHISLSGAESVGILRFLMSLDRPTPEVIAAVQGGVAWFEKSKLTGIRVEMVPAPDLPHGHDRRVVSDPTAPPLWARFYEIGTNRPIFGGRDTLIHYTLAEVEPERRGGYRWYVDEPQKLLEKDYPRWAAKWLKHE